jgi:outer membrane protein assembly factor BamD
MTLRPRSRSHTLLALLLLAGFVSGCSSTPKQPAATAKASGPTDEQIFIGDTIEKNYDPNVIMKRAEAFFEKEEYPEAIIEYQHFLELHRIHTLAPYAQFKLGESHFKMVKTIDRDPDPVYKALESYQKLLQDFPNSRWQADAEDRIRACNDVLAQAAFFVGEFYYRRESYLAAAYRFESILEKYPDMPVAGDALYYAALTYQELGAHDWAQEKLTLLASRFPQHKYAAEGRQLLAKLNAKHPPATSLAAATPAAASEPLFAGTPSAITPAPPDLPSTLAAVAGIGSHPVSSLAPALAPQMTLCRLGSWC